MQIDNDPHGHIYDRYEISLGKTNESGFSYIRFIFNLSMNLIWNEKKLETLFKSDRWIYRQNKNSSYPMRCYHNNIATAQENKYLQWLFQIPL